jgi:hypothetical protein
MKNTRWTGATAGARFAIVKVTRQSTARKLQAYLQGRISSATLVEWAEQAMLKGNFAPDDAAVLRRVVPRLGVADVRAFGLGWSDCTRLRKQLGFRTRIQLSAA